MTDPGPNRLAEAFGHEPASLETTIITRGVMRLFYQRGLDATVEMALPNGRRADVFGVARDGAIHIVEIKVSVADFMADQKWPEYWQCCDSLYFAVPIDFPRQILPQDVGLIVADRYGGEVLVEPPRRALHASTRKSLLIDFGRVCARRLTRALDPLFHE